MPGISCLHQNDGDVFGSLLMRMSRLRSFSIDRGRSLHHRIQMRKLYPIQANPAKKYSASIITTTTAFVFIEAQHRHSSFIKN